MATLINKNIEIILCSLSSKQNYLIIVYDSFEFSSRYKCVYNGREFKKNLETFPSVQCVFSPT